MAARRVAATSARRGGAEAAQSGDARAARARGLAGRKAAEEKRAERERALAEAEFAAAVVAADALVKEEETEDAIEAFRALIEAHPSRPEPYLKLGDCLFEDDQEEESIGAFRSLVAALPDCAAGHGRLGLALRRPGDHQDQAEGYACLKQASKLPPPQLDVLLALGEMELRFRSDSGQAIIQLNKCLRLKPQGEQLFAARLCKAEALVENEDVEEAIDEYRALTAPAFHQQQGRAHPSVVVSLGLLEAEHGTAKGPRPPAQAS